MKTRLCSSYALQHRFFFERISSLNVLSSSSPSDVCNVLSSGYVVSDTTVSSSFFFARRINITRITCTKPLYVFS